MIQQPLASLSEDELPVVVVEDLRVMGLADGGREADDIRRQVCVALLSTLSESVRVN